MNRITTEQRAAVMPAVAPVVPVMSGRHWLGEPTAPCSGNHGTAGFTAKRRTRPLGRSST